MGIIFHLRGETFQFFILLLIHFQDNGTKSETTVQPSTLAELQISTRFCAYLLQNICISYRMRRRLEQDNFFQRKVNCDEEGEQASFFSTIVHIHFKKYLIFKFVY